MKSFIATACCLLLVNFTSCQEAGDIDIVIRPKCSINETEAVGCASFCGPTCLNKIPVIQACTQNCAPCICKPNYLRDQFTGLCVEEKDCYPIPDKYKRLAALCPENSVMVDPCAAEECLYFDIIEEPDYFHIIPPICQCFPECKCSFLDVMYNNKCLRRKTKMVPLGASESRQHHEIKHHDQEKHLHAKKRYHAEKQTKHN